MTFAAGFEIGQKRLGAVDYSPEVDADNPFQVGIVHALHGAGEGHPGIVEHQVDLAVLSHAARGPFFHGLAIGHVQHLGGDHHG